MDLLGGISAAEWSSLNGIYSSEDADHYGDQYIAAAPAHDCAVPNYWPNLGASNLELPFSIGSDSTIIHDMTLAGTYTNQGVSKFCSSQIAAYYASTCNYDHQDALVTSNVAFCGDRGAELFVNNVEGDNHDQWLHINQEVSKACNGEESGGSQSTAAHVVPKLNWDPDMMIKVPDHGSNTELDGSLCGSSKKRSRSTTADEYYQDNQKNKRNVKSRKNKKVALSDNEEDGSAASGEQYSDASQEDVGGVASSPSPKGVAALNLNGKKRATRGSATDPQSVYARKRREKINERLRILQNLVPNGTKVDISTMLEEAVQYVKFLQLQIKLLSSDDLWMYAPLAYNGMDIGLDYLRQLAAPKQ